MKTPLLVLGATGCVGRGVVQAAVAAGWPVIAVARNAGALDVLRAASPGADLTTLPGSVASDSDAAALAAALRGLSRPLAGVVVCLCNGAERGRLLDQPVEVLRRKLDDNLLPHLAAARHLLPLLAEADRGGSYVLVGGPGGEHPWAGYGHRTMAAAALHMLARVLHDEARALSVRVQLLAIGMPLRTDRNRRHACPQWPSALAIGERAVALIERDEPAHAIVRYDAKSPASTASSKELPRQLSPQDPSSEAALLTTRCLQDARTLLKALISPNRNQEAPQ